MPLHVLQLGPYPPPEGGISRNMLAIRDELIASGHRCSIIATTKSNRTDDEPNVYHPRSAFEFFKLLKTIKFDALHLHIGGDVRGRVMMLAAAAAAFGGKRSVLTLHSGAFPQTKEGLNAKSRSVRGFIFRRFVLIIAVNEAIANVFRRYGVSENRIKVIAPYALKCANESVEVPAELSDFIAEHSPVLLSVGGLEKDYDPLFQIAAMKDVLIEFPGAGLMIVGDGSMRDEVENAVKSSGYATHIQIAGNVVHAVTLQLIAAADVLLRTTLFDGDAISIREALFLGTPVIATDTGMRPDGVHLVRIGDKDSLVSKIRELAGTAKPNRTTVPDQTNINAVINLYENLA